MKYCVIKNLEVNKGSVKFHINRTSKVNHQYQQNISHIESEPEGRKTLH